MCIPDFHYDSSTERRADPKSQKDMLWAAENEEFLLEIPPDPPDSEDEDEQDELSSLYDFVEVCVPGPSRQQPNVPGRSTRSVPLILEEDDDEQYMEEDATAGKILFTDQDMQEKWLKGRGKRVPRTESELHFVFCLSLSFTLLW